MNIAILTIGREILIGHTQDTNSAYLCRAVTLCGLRVTTILTVDDNEAAIIAALQNLSASNQIIIITGGIGPTPDDLTRSSIAKFAGVELIFQDELWGIIQARFAAFKRIPTESNKLQAFLPFSASAINNEFGTAPGIDLTVKNTRLFSLPGVPREMYAMFTAYILPQLQTLNKTALYLKRFHCCGIGESQVGEIIAELAPKYSSTEIGTTVDNLVVTIRVMTYGENFATAEKLALPLCNELRTRLGKYFIGEDDENLARTIVQILTARQQTLAIAESCTGGLLSSAIVDVDGASAIFQAGIVSYSNEAKQKLCGVSAELLQNYGAVSEQCVIALAENTRQISGSDYAVSVSGIAGASGGTPEKPVGLTWIAVADKNGVKTAQHFFIADRQGNRERAKNAALYLLLTAINENN